LEDAICLALAADHFFLDLLKGHAATEVKRLVTVETVWTTLETVILCPELATSVCEVIFFVL